MKFSNAGRSAEFHRVDPKLRVLKVAQSGRDDSVERVSSRRPEVEGTESEPPVVTPNVASGFIA